MYDEKAHYLPDEADALHGNKQIAQYWQAAFGYVQNIKLNMQTLEGNENLLYETGIGTVQVQNAQGVFELQNFKYVNVWKKQSDGSYKVVIDTFNSFKPVK